MWTGFGWFAWDFGARTGEMEGWTGRGSCGGSGRGLGMGLGGQMDGGHGMPEWPDGENGHVGDAGRTPGGFGIHSGFVQDARRKDKMQEGKIRCKKEKRTTKKKSKN